MNRYENYYDSGGNYLEDIKHNDSQYISIIPKSAGFISPGDVLSFVYSKGVRVFVFVVRTKRSNGIFLSTRGNFLISCFKLTTTSPQISSAVLKTLYKNKRSASYDKIQKGLEAIFGPSSFRTYNIANISDLNQISIKKERLPSIDDED